MFRSRPRETDHHVAAMVHTESGVILLMASVSGSKSKRRPRLILAEELPAEQAILRVRQLADDVAGTQIRFTLWQALEGADAVALTVPVDPTLRDAPETRKVEACLTQTPWTEDVIYAENLHLNYIARSNRLHFAAVRSEVLEARERQLPSVPLAFSPLAHAVVPLVDAAQPEAAMPKGPMSLTLLCLPRSVGAAVFARGELLLVAQQDLTQYIRDEAAAMREGQTPPFGFRGRVPQTAAELEAVIYHRVLESAIDDIKRRLLAKGENPSAIQRLYYAGEAVDTFELGDYLHETYGASLEVRPILATKATEFPATTEDERLTAQHIVANEAKYATAFALLAMGLSAKPVPFQTSSPEPFVAANVAPAKPAISSPGLLLGVGSMLFFFLACFMSYYWYLGYEIDADRQAIVQEEKQKEIRKEYGAKLADMQAKEAHINELLKIIETEKKNQGNPSRASDDIDRAMRSIPGINSADDPRSRLEWSTVKFDGKAVTISGTAGYRDNAVAFGERLGNLDGRQTFTGVDTTWRERDLPPSEEFPEGNKTWDFTITATYNPPTDN